MRQERIEERLIRMEIKGRVSCRSLWEARKCALSLSPSELKLCLIHKLDIYTKYYMQERDV